MNPVYLILLLLGPTGNFNNRLHYVPGYSTFLASPANSMEKTKTNMGDTCCLNAVLFGQNVRNALTLELDESACQAKLIVQQLPACDSVYFIDWGDGTLDYGPYSNTTLLHSYSQTGDYTIQVPVVEFDNEGGPCFDTMVKYTITMNCSCECGNYSLALNTNELPSPIPSGDTLRLECPIQDSLDFIGFFFCTGNSCSTQPVSWDLTGPNLYLTDSLFSIDFQLKIPPLLDPGFYELSLQSQCGIQSCDYKITIHLMPCINLDPCDLICQGNVWSHLNIASIRDMVTYKDRLIVAGTFKSIGKEELPVNNIAAWDGKSWASLSGGGLNNLVNDLEVYNDILYAGGEFTQAGNVLANKIASWNGTSWSALTHGGINGSFSTIEALRTTSNGLIAGGKFSSVGDAAINASNVAHWHPANGWTALGPGLDGPVFSIAQYQGHLVVGGRFGNIPGGFNNIAIWNNEWTKLGSDPGVNIKTATPNPGDGVHALVEYGGKLIAGGQFLHAYSDTSINKSRTKHLAQWDGINWTAVGKGTYYSESGINTGNGVYTLKVINDELYAGGHFSRINNQNFTKLARWNGTTWSGLSHPAGGVVQSIALFNPDDKQICNLYTGGDSTFNYWACNSVPVSDLIPEFDFKIYPNPAADQYYLEFDRPIFETVSIECYSMFGKKISSVLLPNIKPGSTGPFYTKQMASGTYILKISTTRGSVVKKIVLAL